MNVFTNKVLGLGYQTDLTAIQVTGDFVGFTANVLVTNGSTPPYKGRQITINYLVTNTNLGAAALSSEIVPTGRFVISTAAVSGITYAVSSNLPSDDRDGDVGPVAGVYCYFWVSHDDLGATVSITMDVTTATDTGPGSDVLNHLTLGGDGGIGINVLAIDVKDVLTLGDFLGNGYASIGTKAVDLSIGTDNRIDQPTVNGPGYGITISAGDASGNSAGYFTGGNLRLNSGNGSDYGVQEGGGQGQAGNILLMPGHGNPNGFVGVGQDTPLQMLHVGGHISSYGLYNDAQQTLAIDLADDQVLYNYAGTNTLSWGTELTINTDTTYPNVAINTFNSAGTVVVDGLVKAVGYKSSDGSAGETTVINYRKDAGATLGTMTFKNGLLVAHT